MTTIINTPRSEDSGSNGALLLLALVVLIAGTLFYVYGLPAMRENTESPGITIPDTIQVDVNANEAN